MTVMVCVTNGHKAIIQSLHGLEGHVNTWSPFLLTGSILDGESAAMAAVRLLLEKFNFRVNAGIFKEIVRTSASVVVIAHVEGLLQAVLRTNDGAQGVYRGYHASILLKDLSYPEYAVAFRQHVCSKKLEFDFDIYKKILSEVG